MLSGDGRRLVFGTGSGSLWGEVEVGEGHKEETSKGGAKEGAVHGLKPAVRGRVDIQTAGAEELDGFLAGCVCAANGENFGPVAENAGTVAKVT